MFSLQNTCFLNSAHASYQISAFWTLSGFSPHISFLNLLNLLCCKPNFILWTFLWFLPNTNFLNSTRFLTKYQFSELYCNPYDICLLNSAMFLTKYLFSKLCHVFYQISVFWTLQCFLQDICSLNSAMSLTKYMFSELHIYVP